VVSWLQGTFRLHVDLRTERPIAVQDSAGFETFEPGTRSFNQSGLRNIRVEDLRDLVESADCSNGKCVTAGKK
jgi:hypothetical protein